MRKTKKRLSQGTRVRLIEVVRAMKEGTNQHMTGQAVMLHTLNRPDELNELTAHLSYGRNLVSKIRNNHVPAYTYLATDEEFVEVLQMADEVKYLKGANLSALPLKFTDYKAPEVFDLSTVAQRQSEAFVFHRLPAGQRVCDVAQNMMTMPENLRATFLESEFKGYKELLQYTKKENVIELAADVLPLVASHGKEWLKFYVTR